jgi:protein tyrosine/serine phosphatase
MMCLVALLLNTEYPIYCHAGSGIDKMRYFGAIAG